MRGEHRNPSELISALGGWSSPSLIEAGKLDLSVYSAYNKVQKARLYDAP